MGWLGRKLVSVAERPEERESALSGGAIGAASAEPLLYFCRNNACLGLRELTEMVYGCFKCAVEDKLERDANRAGVLRPLPDMEPSIRDAVAAGDFFARNDRRALPSCVRHRLPIMPHCPVCRGAIEREFGGRHRPITLWAGTAAGKTTVSAAFVKALEQGQLFRLCRLTHSFLNLGSVAVGDYLQTQVAPLFDDGVLLRKTDRNTHAKLVARVQSPPESGWAPRVLVLTDIAGEEAVFDGKAGTGHGAEIAIQILHSRESLFLLNPQAHRGEGTIGARIPIHLAETLLAVAVVLDQHQVLGALPPNDDHAAAIMSALFQDLHRTLRDRHFPGGGDFPGLAAALVRRISETPAVRGGLPAPGAGRAALETALAEALATEAARSKTRTTFQEQAGQLAALFGAAGYPRDEAGRFQHRLAVMVSKGDLLAAAGVAALPPDFARLAGQAKEPWRDALAAESQRCRELLVELGEVPFVEQVERNFASVGYFFSSVLGREPEPIARCFYPEAKPASDGMTFGEAAFPMDSDVGFGGAHSAPTPARRREWQVGAQLGEKQKTGSRAPEPWGILPPLLWVLAG